MLSLWGVNENPLSQTPTKLARRAMAEHGAKHPPRCAVRVLQASCLSSCRSTCRNTRDKYSHIHLVMSMSAAVLSSLRNVSRVFRKYTSIVGPSICREPSVQRALATSGVCWSIGHGPHAVFTRFRLTNQLTPGAFLGLRGMQQRSYQSYNSFVRSYQYG
jgi:hypothetical protein